MLTKTTKPIPTNRLDEQDTIFFERELESVKSQTYDVKFPRLRFAEGDLIPISFEAGAGVSPALALAASSAGSRGLPG